MPHVEELDPLAVACLPGGVVSRRDLPPAGDARLHGEELVAGVAELEGLGLGHGPGPDHGEVPDEDVEELGQLVEGGAPQHAADARDAGVVVDLLLALPLGELLGRHVPLRVLVGVRHHGAELVDADRPAAQPHALLTEDRRARGVQPYGEAQKRPGHQAHQARRAGEGDVEGALHGAVAQASPPGRGDARVGRRGDEGRGGRALLARHVLLAR